MRARWRLGNIDLCRAATVAISGLTQHRQRDASCAALRGAQDPHVGGLFAALLEALNPSRVVVISGPAYWVAPRGGSTSFAKELEGALRSLCGNYQKSYQAWKTSGTGTPPVFIVVCQNTNISKLVSTGSRGEGGWQ